MRARSTTLAAVAATITFVAAGAAHAAPQVAVLGIEVIDDGSMDPKTTTAAKALTDALRAEASKPGAALELAPNSNKDLLTLKLLSDCSDEGKGCMAQIGKELKADKLLFGKIERRRNGYQVSLRLLDVATGEMDMTTSDIVPFGETTTRGINHWGRTLFNRLIGAPEDGSLKITANVDRGSVYIDGEIKTSLSGGVAKVPGLSEGTHKVAIEAPGRERYDAEVAITAGQTEELSVSLTANGGGGGADDSSPGNGWKVTFWSATIVAGLSGAAWIYEGKRIRDFETEKVGATKEARDGGVSFLPAGTMPGDQIDVCDVAASSANASNPAADHLRGVCSKAQSASTRTYFLEGPLTLAGGALAVFAGVMWYRTHEHESEDREARLRSRPTSRVVELVPTVTPTTVGAGLAIEF